MPACPEAKTMRLPSGEKAGVVLREPESLVRATGGPAAWPESFETGTDWRLLFSQEAL